MAQTFLYFFSERPKTTLLVYQRQVYKGKMSEKCGKPAERSQSKPIKIQVLHFIDWLKMPEEVHKLFIGPREMLYNQEIKRNLCSVGYIQTVQQGVFTPGINLLQRSSVRFVGHHTGTRKLWRFCTYDIHT